MSAPSDAVGHVRHQTMHTRLGSLIRREPVTVAPTSSVRAALQEMERHRIGSIVVVEDGSGIPLGIFTLLDLLRRVALPDLELDQPIAQVMTRDLVSLGAQATAYDAALTMARHRLRHVLVVGEDGRLVGIVSQNDLFALQRVGIKEISNEIGAAEDLDSLIRSAQDIRLLADNMLAQGVGAEPLTHFISTLNDLLTLRLIELTRREFALPEVPWCWIALGSEGRFEQTFSSDQDNGIVFDAGDGDAEAIRQQLLPFALAVNRKLDRCGFLLCKGNIMASNPLWCLSLDEWQGKFGAWLASPTPQAILNASIFFDFRPLYGEHALAHALRAWLLDACRRNVLFLHHMARDALRRRPPLGLLSQILVDRSGDFPGTIDLKMVGAWPFVDAARIFSLAAGVAETNTAQRLRLAMARTGEQGSDEVAALVEAFYYIQSLRLRHQHTLQGRVHGANRIRPAALNEFDRRMLKEAFRQARKLQRRLRLEYQPAG